MCHPSLNKSFNIIGGNFGSRLSQKITATEKAASAHNIKANAPKAQRAGNTHFELLSDANQPITAAPARASNDPIQPDTRFCQSHLRAMPHSLGAGYDLGQDALRLMKQLLRSILLPRF